MTKLDKRPARPKWLPAGIAHYGDLPDRRTPVHGCWLHVYESTKRGYAATLEIDFHLLPSPTVAGWALIWATVEAYDCIRVWSHAPFFGSSFQALYFKSHSQACCAVVQVAAVIAELYEAGQILPVHGSDPLEELPLKAQKRSELFLDRVFFRCAPEEDRAKALPRLDQQPLLNQEVAA